jgi:acetolactate synthase-1/2/3 large subunit
MKFPSAALALVAAATAVASGCSAFVPSSSPYYATSSLAGRSAFVPGQLKRRRHQSSSRGADAGARYVPCRASIEEEIEIVNALGVSTPDTPVAATDAAQRQNFPVAPATRDDARRSAAAYLKKYDGGSTADIIYTKLIEHGVEVVNGYSGGAVLPLLDQFHVDHPRHGGEAEKIRWITNSNESSAGHIAEGFAKCAPVWRDGRMQAGVVVATSGPGVTNLITPITDAICDGVPMVVLCGQAATFAPEAAFQQCPAVDLTRPVTKWSYQIKSAAEVPFVMDYAFYVARSGRPGPVFIDLPKDLQNQPITDGLIEEFTSGLGDVGTTGGEDDFVSFATHVRPDGQGHHTLYLGDAKDGLSFSVSDDEALSLTPILKARQGGSDVFELDAHASNTIHESRIETDGSTTNRVGTLASGEILSEMLNLIKGAKKPIIIAGQGCNDAPEELKVFAEALQIPVTTTLHGMGVFDERHPLALNMLGMHGHATPNFMVQEADLIINIGSRFDDRITGALGAFIPEARQAAVEGRGGVIHVDIRKSEHGKQVEPNFFVHSTGVDFLRAANRELGLDNGPPASPATTTRGWLVKKAQLERDFPVPIPEYMPQMVTVTDESGAEQQVVRTKMSSQLVIKRMDQILLEAGRMDDCFFSTGVGIHQMVAAQHLTWTKPRQMLSSGSLGTMGVCLGYTIGAKLANPGAICIGIDGDGSFNMTFTELKTVAEQKIPIKMIILDNESQMMVEYWQRLFHAERYLAVRNDNPDYCTLADSFKIKSIYCDHVEDLDEKMNEFLFADPDEPVLFHCRVERTPCMPMVAPGKALDDMIHRDESFAVDPKAAPS